MNVDISISLLIEKIDQVSRESGLCFAVRDYPSLVGALSRLHRAFELASSQQLSQDQSKPEIWEKRESGISSKLADFMLRVIRDVEDDISLQCSAISCLSYIVPGLGLGSGFFQSVCGVFVRFLCSHYDHRIRQASGSALMRILNSSEGQRKSIELSETLISSIVTAFPHENLEQVKLNMIKIVILLSGDLLAASKLDGAVQIPKHHALLNSCMELVRRGMLDVQMSIRALCSRAFGDFWEILPSALFLQALSKKPLSSTPASSPNQISQTRKKVKRDKGAHVKKRDLFIAEGDFSIEDGESLKAHEERDCGVLIHGLEDEFQQVRLATLSSLFKFCNKPENVRPCLDFIIDMFNDEIEEVRLYALHGLLQLCKVQSSVGVVTVDEDQLNTVIGVLGDTNVEFRLAGRELLSQLKIPTGSFQSVLATMFNALSKHPKEKSSIFKFFYYFAQKNAEFFVVGMETLLKFCKVTDTKPGYLFDHKYVCILFAFSSVLKLHDSLLEKIPAHIIAHLRFVTDMRDEYFDITRKNADSDESGVLYEHIIGLLQQYGPNDPELISQLSLALVRKPLISSKLSALSQLLSCLAIICQIKALIRQNLSMHPQIIELSRALRTDCHRLRISFSNFTSDEALLISSLIDFSQSCMQACSKELLSQATPSINLSNVDLPQMIFFAVRGPMNVSLQVSARHVEGRSLEYARKTIKSGQGINEEHPILLLPNLHFILDSTIIFTNGSSIERNSIVLVINQSEVPGELNPIRMTFRPKERDWQTNDSNVILKMSRRIPIFKNFKRSLQIAAEVKYQCGEGDDYIEFSLTPAVVLNAELWMNKLSQNLI